MKKFVSGAIAAAVVCALAFADIAGSLTALPAAAAGTPSITLNGTVAQGDPGYLNSKAIVFSTGSETKVNFRLTPNYATGQASGITVTINLPSLEYVDGGYRPVAPGSAPTPLGVQGTLRAGSGWTVDSGPTTVRGGKIVMRYDGDLGAGGNPAFDLLLTTYNDGTAGFYGGVPEGTAFEINGSVSYEMFDRVPGSSWSTPNALDDASRVTAISSDLSWEAGIESYVPAGGQDTVPIWDRYQYIDYTYVVRNTSKNVASNIDGYSVTFDIDSTDSKANGIIPFDINRWKYRDGSPAVENENPDDTSGQFVGVPGKGGVLIYDITEWDGTSELSDPIPYTYAGAGMVVIDRERGAQQQSLTPDGAPGTSERKYLISLPLSRQGFPNPPTMFKVRAVTNVLFAKSANWSKTAVVEREIVHPNYSLTFEHTTKQPEVVYGYETFTEIAKIRNASNAPVFAPRVDVAVDPDVVVDRVTYAFDDAERERFENVGLTYTYIDAGSAQPVTDVLRNPTALLDPDTGIRTLTFDVSALNALDWDRRLGLTLVDRLEPGDTLPLTIRVFGEPHRIGDVTASATITYIEKIASNDDFGQNTSYTEVEHTSSLDATYAVIYPDEVIPEIRFVIDGTADQATVDYGDRTRVDVHFGVNDTTAENSTTTVTINDAADEALEHIELTLRPELFTHAENVRVSYRLFDGTVHPVDLSGYDLTEPVTIALPAKVADVVIDTDAFTSDGAFAFASFTADVEKGLSDLHALTGAIRTYQPRPYDTNTTRTAEGILDIRLPNKLRPEVDAIGIYGSLETRATTNVSYESTFDVDYRLGTGGVTSPESTYRIDMLAPTKTGGLAFREIRLQAAYLATAGAPTVTFVDAEGNEQVFAATRVDRGEVTLDSISAIVIAGSGVRLDRLVSIARVSYDADLALGSSQTVQATFVGTQQAPYPETATATSRNVIAVRETQTGVKVEGVNQVTGGLGVGNSYTVDIYRHWGAGYTYNTRDYTLDQGYKSLGGFTSTLTRPTAVYDNNDQRVNVDVQLPYQHFDTYYVKIRDDLKPYVDTVDIYRMVDGIETLWKSVDGSEWVENTREGTGFWRIATARPGTPDAELSATYGVGDREDHPYYKQPWDADVRPTAPVSRVDVTLNFTRESADAKPQLSGVSDDVIEYMGRFYSTSVDGKRDTTLTATDRFGTRTEQTRTATTSIKSLVAHPFAQSRTGAEDSTSLANKVVPMGGVGEYLASIWNTNTASWSYYGGHGPDVYAPAATEYDEWLGLHDPGSFHDTLIYEFVYPADPDTDPNYHLDAQYVTLEANSALKYLSGVEIFDGAGASIRMDFPAPFTDAPRFAYDHSLPRGIHDRGEGRFAVSLGEGEHPSKFQAIFTQISGFGDDTAELDGPAEDTLGTSLSEVDVRVGGIVNGNRALRGTTNLYRLPDDTGVRTLMHTSSATLTGYTPKLGARLDMSFDSVKVYDYGADGITPNTSRVTLGMENVSEADIKDLTFNFTPDTEFRSQLLEIPDQIFDAADDWRVTSVSVRQGATATEIGLDRFRHNAASGMYELDLRSLFADGTLRTETAGVILGGSATLRKQHVDRIDVSFAAKDPTVALWGSFARAESAEELPVRMMAGGDVFVSGVWVDEDETGQSNWNSKPTFVTELTKASNESIVSYSSFNVAGQVTPYQTIFASAGGGNTGQKPVLTLASSGSSAAAPRLYSRVARLQTHATHLTEDLQRVTDRDVFFDADTGRQISATNVAVGDTTKVLYELRNVGARAASDTGPGALPVFAPRAHILVPKGLEISDVQATTAFLAADPNLDAVVRESPNTAHPVTVDAVAVEGATKARRDIVFDTTLDFGESVFFFVEFTAINDFSADLFATQNQASTWSVLTRPAFSHHFMSYNSDGVTDSGRVTGDATTGDYDGNVRAEHLGRVQNVSYRFANPDQVQISSVFDRENISGESMTLTVTRIANEILHDNTALDLFVTLDTGQQSAFELTEFPRPAYPHGFVGEFAEPRVFFRIAAGSWTRAEDFDPATQSMRSINELKISYGAVPALHNGAKFAAEDVRIVGKGHWATAGALNTKSYAISSKAETQFTHQDAQGIPVAKYRDDAVASRTVWKAIPTVEFNIQSFGSRAEAEAPYSAAATGKTDYVAGDKIHYKLTARNQSTFQGAATNTPYGKAPLLKPVIYDRIPEYLTAELLAFVREGELDVAAAVAAGALEIRFTDANGDARSFVLPTVAVETVTGLDVAGAQTFANDRHNDGWGLLSSGHPTQQSLNPAKTISFTQLAYRFSGEMLDRGEQLEIIYPTRARMEDLPRATYDADGDPTTYDADGEAVFAPLFGWYGNNNVTANNAKHQSMDMASLLHDAGISGDRGHEMTPSEFLSRSSAWHPGTTAKRRQPISASSASWQTTFYDGSADLRTSHVAYLRETPDNDLYESTADAAVRDESFNLATRARVNDGTVSSPERVLWAQDGVHLTRAWLYGASEMVPSVERGSHGESSANFYEHDGSLNSANISRRGYTPYAEDDYTYAVELHERFTIKLHATNLGDRRVEHGLEYTEILPLGTTPYDDAGKILGITAYDGHGSEIPSSYDVIQSPSDDRGYRAPAQSQEAGTYRADTRDDMIPYVVRVRVASPLGSMFNAPASAVPEDKHQRVDITARVFEELAPSADDRSYWHDQFTLTTITEEPYVEIYHAGYGGYDAEIGAYNTHRFPNDGMPQGTDVTDLLYYPGYYSSYVSFEPWGRYIRGLNAQGSETVSAGKPAIVTGDQLAMRKPTLRVWSTTTKDHDDPNYDDSIERFTVDPYEQFTINSIVENQQLEVQPEYNRVSSGYNWYSGDNLNDDIWREAPQTIGGARGSWFEPVVTIALPYGVAPVLGDGSTARYYTDPSRLQDPKFTAEVHRITFDTSTTDREVTRFFDTEVEILEDAAGKRFVLHFTANTDRAANVAYGESLVISPRVAVIDTPAFNGDRSFAQYQQTLTLANTERPVFNPVVSAKYTTGSPASLTAVDQGLQSPNNVKSHNGKSITANDRTRRDSTSTWTSNMGALKITERLISATERYDSTTSIALHRNGTWTVPGAALTPTGDAGKHQKSGAFGGTTLNARHATLHNTTLAATTADARPSDTTQVDAAGKYWYVTEIENRATLLADPYETMKTAGHLHNAQLLVTTYVTDFAQPTGEVRIAVDGRVYTPAEFEALGYTVERVTPRVPEADGTRQRVQWLVTTPANGQGIRGELRSGAHVTLLHQVELTDGYADDALSDDPVWTAPELTADSYVSVIANNLGLIPDRFDPRDFIVQSVVDMGYVTEETDQAAGADIDSNGTQTSIYAADATVIQILKPRAEVRVNTTRPRIAYSNGLSGDTYFNSSDVIEYLTTYAKVTGSGLKQFVVENVLPTHQANDASVSLSNREIETSALYVSSGAWELPQSTLDRIEAAGAKVDELFATYVYLSDDLAEEGYETAGWTLLNPGGAKISVNERIAIPAEARSGLRKFRVVLTALDPGAFLVPTGTRLAVDADPAAAGDQEVVETDPGNHSTTQYPASVVDQAITVGMRISSQAKSTLFIYDTAQAWGNYVADRVTKLAQSETRSYLTPSRPVVDVVYDAEYFRSETSRPLEERFGWSDIMAIAPKSSPHLKFSGEFTNADRSMWLREEDNTYAEDTLVDPFVTFLLPTVLESGGAFTYVPADRITSTHPLSSEYRSRFPLTDAETNLWTWRLVRADGGPASDASHLTQSRIHSGPWPGSDRNVVSVWFDGSVEPGDKLVVEFIGAVDAYSPEADAEGLKSRAMLSNNTGLLSPLNSRLQQGTNHHLGYTTDSADLTDNSLLNDRLVFSERSLFQYESFDDFGKRKVASSDLNRAGTVAPEATPVREGGLVTYELSVDNSKDASGTPYPYPILYDVLPHVSDTSITNAAAPRGSQYSGWFQPNGLKLERLGADKKTYASNEYTVFVGPLTQRGGKVVPADMIPQSDAASEAFYDALGVPGQPSALRDAHFVELGEIARDPDLLRQVRTVLVLFNDANETLPGQNQLKLTYQIKSPLNAPVYLEGVDDPAAKQEALIWNSFMATQRVSKFIPQESNNAGAYAIEKQGAAYLGNYVWHDADYDGTQNEGETFTDENGRTLLRPAKDLDFDGTIDDPGINGVTVSLLSPTGYRVDHEGNPIHRVGDAWQIVDEATGQSVLDDVFGRPIESAGPLTTVTETDFHGNAGYFTFSNIQPGDYRVMYEFPQSYARYAVTTPEVFGGSGVKIFLPGESDGLPVDSDTGALVAITEVASVDADSSDAERMSFDIGIAQKVIVGGDVFRERLATLDGYRAADELGIPGYHVTLRRMDGTPVVDPQGEPMVTTTDGDGRYQFDLLPVDRQYYLTVTDETDSFNSETVVSPMIHQVDPFALDNDNDGLNEKGSTVVRTNTLDFGLRGLVDTGFAERRSVSVGFYDKSTTGVIGNRVWEDTDRDGVQDPGEPGVRGQELRLQQWVRDSGAWRKTALTRHATSNADGYYYFTEVPSVYTEGTGADRVDFETKYQVVVDALVEGYAFAPMRQGSSDEFDSDFAPNGTLHATGTPVGDHLVSVADVQGGVVYGLDDNTVDLGLVPHARSTLSGEIFLDPDRDGLQHDAAPVEPRYTATLEVRDGGTWVVARQTADGRMIEPAKATAGDPPIRQIGVDAYRFDGLHIIDPVRLVPYEYRVVVSDIPLWQNVTAQHRGTDPTIDSDFALLDRREAHTARSDARILGTLQEELLPIDTLTGVPATNVDLGLVSLTTEVTIGDRIWLDQDRDGIQGAVEAGIPGVRVVLNRLTGGRLEPVDETTTDGNGFYTFTAEVADTRIGSPTLNRPFDYVVEIVLSSRHSLAPSHAGNDDTVNSKFEMLEARGYDHSVADPAHTAVSSPFRVVGTDTNGLASYDTATDTDRIDGGVLRYDTVRVIGDTVFEDVDGDGIQDAGEPGIPGLVARLFMLDPATGEWEAHTDLSGRTSATTDGAGGYEFSVEVADLDKASPFYRTARQYRVLLEAPANLRLVETNTPFAYRGTQAVPGITIEKPFSHVLSSPQTLVATGPDGVVLDTAHDVRTADAGFRVFATEVTIGGLVWEDANADGVQDPGEQPLAGKPVQLWELMSGEWTRIDDLTGATTAISAADGTYRFLVSPTHYDEAAANFLQPREYRVSAEREGYQVWSPTHAGNDAALDSDMAAPAPEFGSAHTGASSVFSIADVDGTTVDVTSVRDDVEMDMGLRTSPSRATIGGVVWEDADENGSRDAQEPVMAGQTVTLWERVSGSWKVVADARGETTQLTDADGTYVFEVAPTVYDVNSPAYLQPREYRVSVATMEDYRLSEGSVGAEVDGARVVSEVARITELDAMGQVDITAVGEDRSLDFPFVRLPAASGLSLTGSELTILPAAGLLLIGAGLLLVGLRRRRGAHARRGS